ncbi:esterase/lipase family protein [Yinghuangia aomiensis]
MPACPGPVLGAVRELAWLVGHLVLYPTGLFTPGPAPEPHAKPPSAPAPPPPRSSSSTAWRTTARSSPYCGTPCTGRGSPTSTPSTTTRSAATSAARPNCSTTTSHGYVRGPARLYVHVVGHSLGGLVARYHAQRIDRGAHVRTVVTLGTPTAGRWPPISSAHTPWSANCARTARSSPSWPCPHRTAPPDSLPIGAISTRS